MKTRVRETWGHLMRTYSIPVVLGGLVVACGSSPTSIVTKTPAEGDKGSGDLTIEQKYQKEFGDGDATGLKKVEESFMSSKKEKANFELSANATSVNQSLVMESETQNAKLNHKQGTRPNHIESFTQGSTSTLAIDNFSQQGQTQGILDIMVVIDNSGSMSQEQQNFSTKLSPLLSAVSGSDWRIAVNTTDPANGSLRALIQKGDADIETAFANAVNAGIAGSGNERGILQAVNGLQALNQNTSWVRPNSTVAVLIVSDEDNCSAGNDCGTAAHASSSYLVDYLASIRAVGVNARVYGLIWHASQPQTACSTAANKANIYSDAIARTNGTWGSVCSSDYTQTLTAISQNLSVILESQFALTYAPIAGTEKVYLNGQLITSGYTITSNVIQFAQAPANGTAIRVEYQHSPKAVMDRFFLSKPAVAEGMQVQLDASVAASNSYVFDNSNNSVYFPGGAPAATTIRISYKENSGLSTEFAMPTNALEGSVKVSVNGQAQSSGMSIDYVNSKVRFASAPAEGADIVIECLQKVAPKLSYPMVIDGFKNGFEVRDAASGQPLPFTIVGNNVVFESTSFVQGRKLIVSFQNIASAQGKVKLLERPIESSLSVKSLSGSTCSLASLSNNVLDISACMANGPVNVSYEYLTEKKLSFSLSAEKAELIKGAVQEWAIFVNGVKQDVKSYVRQGVAVSFSDLPDEAKIALEVKYYQQQK